MNKVEFLEELRARLAGLPSEDVRQSCDYYEEMLNDRIEDGMSEDEAVGQVGTPAQAAESVLAEIPLSKLIKARIRPQKKLSTMAAVLLAVGSIVWIPLLISAVAVAVSVYVSLGAVLISLWAIGAALCGCALGGVFAFFLFTFTGNAFTGVGLFACGLVCAGLCILMWYVCKYASKAAAWLTKKMVLGIKRGFVRKEEK